MSKRSRRDSQPEDQSGGWDPFATLANQTGANPQPGFSWPTPAATQASDPFASQPPAFDPYAAPAAPAFDPYAPAAPAAFDPYAAPAAPAFGAPPAPPAYDAPPAYTPPPAPPAFDAPPAPPSFAPPAPPSFAPPAPPAPPTFDPFAAPAPVAAPTADPFAAPSFDNLVTPPAPPAPVAPPAQYPAEPVVSHSASFSDAVPPVPPAPPAPPAPSVIGQPGSTRMHEDSEVVAAARRAQPIAPPPPPAPIDDNAPPIVIPGASGFLPGIVPPPPVPTIDTSDATPPTYAFDDTGLQSSVSVGNPAAPAPVSAVSTPLVGGAAATVSLPAEESEAWAPRARRDAQVPESRLEDSASVSAVAGMPDAGAPMAARASVSAQHPEAGIPDDEDEDLDHTVIAVRKRPVWSLGLPLGTKLTLTSDYVILGRKPADEPAFPSAQLIPIADGTRTISKTHAVLALVDGSWTITDLGSTNGVVLIDENGAEQELAANTPAQLTRRFLLGDAELTIESKTE